MTSRLIAGMIYRKNKTIQTTCFVSMPDAAPIIDPDHAAFLEGGVGISVAACSSENIPTLVRATGCRVAPDRQSLTVFVSGTQAAPVINCIRANGAIAAVFSKPSTHRTVQLKGRDATVVDLLPDDLQRIAEYRLAFVGQLVPRGYPEQLIRTLFSYPPSDIVGLRFTPIEAFSQTPGPRAGEPLRSRP